MVHGEASWGHHKNSWGRNEHISWNSWDESWNGSEESLKQSKYHGNDIDPTIVEEMANYKLTTVPGKYFTLC